MIHDEFGPILLVLPSATQAMPTMNGREMNSSIYNTERICIYTNPSISCLYFKIKNDVNGQVINLKLYQPSVLHPEMDIYEDDPHLSSKRVSDVNKPYRPCLRLQNDQRDLAIIICVWTASKRVKLVKHALSHHGPLACWNTTINTSLGQGRNAGKGLTSVGLRVNPST